MNRWSERFRAFRPIDLRSRVFGLTRSGIGAKMVSPGRVPKWSKGTDCKSVIRGFESHRDLSPTPCLAAGRLRSAAVGLRLASLAGFKSHRDLSDDAPFCGGRCCSDRDGFASR